MTPQGGRSAASAACWPPNISASTAASRPAPEESMPLRDELAPNPSSAPGAGGSRLEADGRGEGSDPSASGSSGAGGSSPEPSVGATEWRSDYSSVGAKEEAAAAVQKYAAASGSDPIVTAGGAKGGYMRCMGCELAATGIGIRYCPCHTSTLYVISVPVLTIIPLSVHTCKEREP